MRKFKLISKAVFASFLTQDVFTLDTIAYPPQGTSYNFFTFMPRRREKTKINSPTIISVSHARIHNWGIRRISPETSLKRLIFFNHHPTDLISMRFI